MESQREPSECPGCRKLQAEAAALRAEVDKLRAALEAALRGGKRQAAPFRKADAPQPEPKKPDRKPGEKHGPHAHRIAPPHRIESAEEQPLTKGRPEEQTPRRRLGR